MAALEAAREWAASVIPPELAAAAGGDPLAALAATAATHLMWATAATLILTAADSCLWWMWIVGIVDLFFWAAGDVVCFLALSSAD